MKQIMGERLMRKGIKISLLTNLLGGHGLRLSLGYGTTAIIGCGVSLDANPETNYCPRISIAISLLTLWFELEVL